MPFYCFNGAHIYVNHVNKHRASYCKNPEGAKKSCLNAFIRFVMSWRIFFKRKKVFPIMPCHLVSTKTCVRGYLTSISGNLIQFVAIETSGFFKIYQFHVFIINYTQYGTCNTQFFNTNEFTYQENM